jgi:2-polyprenyl-3-methyl-5-hydroxy-6-metoxy-1,4-benzoquinol methylase
MMGASLTYDRKGWHVAQVPGRRDSVMQAGAQPRIGIVVVAYNAESTMLTTLDRIPVSFRPRIAEVIVCDDASEDETFEHARQWAARADTPITHVLRHSKNLGYGGNQKAAYALALEHGLDIVVLLHADGQYAPESLPDLVAPFESGDCAAVFGSRMMIKGAARRGGMPLYKWLGNRVLTRFENRLLSTDLTEFHSGYRAYRTDVLRQIPFEANSDGFDFDTQIIAQVLHAGGRIEEVPIPTYYGDEICYVDGVKYAWDVARDVVEYRLAVRGFGTPEWVPTPDEYAFKEGDGSSHAVILDMMSDLPPSRVLDVGCSGGLLAEQLRAAGHRVVGVDYLEVPGVRDRTDDFFVVDLEQGIPAEVGGRFDVVIAGDVIEHVSRPDLLLNEIRRVLRPGGQLMLSVPNFGHWYPRLRVSLGIFGYDRRGILDQTHLRFFTRSTLRRIVRSAGFDVLAESATGLPLGTVTGGTGKVSWIRRIDGWLVRARPTLFGYQHILRLTPHAEETIQAAALVEAEDDLPYAARA